MPRTFRIAINTLNCTALLSRRPLIASMHCDYVERADLVARYNKDTAWRARAEAFEKVSAHISGLLAEPAHDRSMMADRKLGDVLGNAKAAHQGAHGAPQVVQTEIDAAWWAVEGSNL